MIDQRLLSDPTFLGGLAVAATLLVLASVLMRRRPRPELITAPLAQMVAELQGRLAQMSQSQVAAQAVVAERLQAQERILTRSLEERLAAVGQRVGDRLQEQTTEATKSLSDLRERLAVIDAAHLVQSALPPSAYSFQATLASGVRADCLLLPNPPGSIALDAKFPLESYRALREARDEAAVNQARRQFSVALRTLVRAIAEKYIVPGETADSTLMFLPSEAVYAELHATFPALVEETFRSRVWIVSPTTLMATLTTVRAVLKDVHLREQAHIIQGELRGLLDDVVRPDERVAKLQRHFEQATEDVRQIRFTTEKVGKRAERIEELQVGNVSGAYKFADAEALEEASQRPVIQ